MFHDEKSKINAPSIGFRISTNDPPKLLYPIDLDSFEYLEKEGGLSISLKWQHIPEKNYELHLKKNDTLLLNKNLDVNQIVVSNLTAGKYQWKIRLSGKKAGKWSSSRSFNIFKEEPLFDIKKVSPPIADEKKYQQKTIIYGPKNQVLVGWKLPSKDISNYSFLVKVYRERKLILQKESKGQVLDIKEIGDGSFTWTVQYLKDNELGGPSIPGTIFIEKPPIPTPPQFPTELTIDIAPKSRGPSSDSSFINWKRLRPEHKYFIQVSNNNNFTKLIEEKVLSEPSYQWTKKQTGVYFIRIATIDGWGRKGTFSNSLRLNIINSVEIQLAKQKREQEQLLKAKLEKERIAKLEKKRIAKLKREKFEKERNANRERLKNQQLEIKLLAEQKREREQLEKEKQKQVVADQKIEKEKTIKKKPPEKMTWFHLIPRNIFLLLGQSIIQYGQESATTSADSSVLQLHNFGIKGRVSLTNNWHLVGEGLFKFGTLSSGQSFEDISAAGLVEKRFNLKSKGWDWFAQLGAQWSTLTFFEQDLDGNIFSKFATFFGAAFTFGIEQQLGSIFSHHAAFNMVQGGLHQLHIEYFWHFKLPQSRWVIDAGGRLLLLDASTGTSDQKTTINKLETQILWEIGYTFR